MKQGGTFCGYTGMRTSLLTIYYSQGVLHLEYLHTLIKKTIRAILQGLLLSSGLPFSIFHFCQSFSSDYLLEFRLFHLFQPCFSHVLLLASLVICGICIFPFCLFCFEMTLQDEDLGQGYSTCSFDAMTTRHVASKKYSSEIGGCDT
ncbi:hypothetical protein AUEXF2481DRAFT_290227 [Aureobasidium subglaciale EXF-2481]|uniref:Uncharacterized protein n=1 Tax=Aureobasidium subglaciale (strain EXF-2481) TaxID=1043005 RepID=A0A074YDB0_AURSE|nr:uncharacterized protein AUEXF2481DRAFT_290227 [Aureobasidium subglaciale EXF-2481]KEQ94034.1 hypothetical protein AUEXF2481DRAFT_290227 [Aureobasidium subglaciale EXF-2481]